MEGEPGVNWNECAKVKGNGDDVLDLSECHKNRNYTGTCFNSLWDVSRNTSNQPQSLAITKHYCVNWTV